MPAKGDRTLCRLGICAASTAGLIGVAVATTCVPAPVRFACKASVVCAPCRSSTTRAWPVMPPSDWRSRSTLADCACQSTPTAGFCTVTVALRIWIFCNCARNGSAPGCEGGLVRSRSNFSTPPSPAGTGAVGAGGGSRSSRTAPVDWRRTSMAASSTSTLRGTTWPSSRRLTESVMRPRGSEIGALSAPVVIVTSRQRISSGESLA